MGVIRHEKIVFTGTRMTGNNCPVYLFKNGEVEEYLLFYNKSGMFIPKTIHGEMLASFEEKGVVREKDGKKRRVITNLQVLAYLEDFGS